MTTSMFFAYILFCIGHTRRNLPDRAWACLSFKMLLERLVMCTGSFRPLCHRDPARDSWQELTVNKDLRLPPAFLWTERSVTDAVAEAWGQDLYNDEKPWVRRSLSSMTLPDFLAFAFDPEHSQELQARLQPNALSIMSQLADILDGAVPTLGRQCEPGTIRTQKNRVPR